MSRPGYKLPPIGARETFKVIDAQSRREWSALIGIEVGDSVRVTRPFYERNAAAIHGIQMGAAFRRPTHSH